MGFRQWILTVILGASLLLAPASAPGSMSVDPLITADPVFQFEPAKPVRLTLSLPRQHGDKFACWGWVRYYTVKLRNGTTEDRDEGRRSCMELHGEHDSRYHYPVYSGLQWGEYVAFLHIYDQTKDLDRPRLVSTGGFKILKQFEE